MTRSLHPFDRVVGKTVTKVNFKSELAGFDVYADLWLEFSDGTELAFTIARPTIVKAQLSCAEGDFSPEADEFGFEPEVTL